MSDRLLREADPPAGLIASPKPQVWDPTANGGDGGYVPVYGLHNAPRTILYGPDGNPISNTNPLETRVRELETLIGALNAAAATAGGEGSVSAKLRRLTADVSDLLSRVGATNAAAQTDPTQTASEIALLKGLLNRLNSLVALIDGGALKTTLSGSIAETIEALEERVNELTPSRLEHYFREGTLENGAVEVVFDSGAGESLSLVMIEFTSESASAQIEVAFYDAENAIKTFTHLTGAGLNAGSFASLSALNTAGGTGGTGLFEITEWNEESTPKLRRAILRPEYTPFPFPNGLRVRVRNNSGNNFRCACRVVVLR